MPYLQRKQVRLKLHLKSDYLCWLGDRDGRSVSAAGAQIYLANTLLLVPAVHSVQYLRERERPVSFCLPGAQGVPGCIDISVKVLLRRLASADAVARVIVGKNVAVDAGA